MKDILRASVLVVVFGWAVAARGASPAAFDGRCIPPGCVAPSSNIADILSRRALPAGRIPRLGATLDLRHRLLWATTLSADSGEVSPAPAGVAATPPGPTNGEDPKPTGDTPQEPTGSGPDARPKSGEGDAAGAAQPAAPAPAEDDEQDDDLSVDPIEHDYTVVNLPTTVRLPSRKSAFRITHRFARSLDDGDFGDLVEDLFGLDSGAVIGLEFRYGLARGTQLSVHRSTEGGARTIQFILQHNFWKQGDAKPIGMDAFVSLEGQQHLRRAFSYGLGVIASRRFAERVAGYLQPILVLNQHRPGAPDEDEPVLMLGVGLRFRLTPRMYFVGEAAPRLYGIDGYNRGLDHGAVAMEWRVGGHAFQLNFSNSFGTTIAQMARGGPPNRGWHIGFNITRKFF